MRRCWRSMRLTALALLLALPGAVNAQTAQQLLEEAVDAFRLAQFERSQALLEQARSSARDDSLLARIHVYIGLNHAMRGDVEQARSAFDLALRRDPSLQLDPRQTKAELVELFNEYRRGLRGELKVGLDVSAASVIVDGRELGAPPLQMKLPIGPHTVEVRSRDGLDAYATRVIVTPQRAVQVVARLQRRHGRLMARTSPVGAEVWIDGRLRGRTPLEVELAAGSHELMLRHEGHRERVESIVVVPDQPLRLNRSLEALPPAAAPPPPERAGRLWTWVAAGGALVALGVGIGAAISANNGYDEWQQHCPQAPYWPDCSTLEQSVRRREVMANVSFGTAAALTVTSALLYVVEGRKTAVTEHAERPSVRRAAIAPLLGGAVGGALSIPF